MANSVFQSVIVQLKEITDRTFGVIDTEGCVVSCTDMALLGERWADAALKVGNASEGIVTFNQKCFKAIVGIELRFVISCREPSQSSPVSERSGSHLASLGMPAAGVSVTTSG